VDTVPIPFDPEAGIPGYLYVKLADYLAERIRDGTLPSGAALPNEHALAAEFEVSLGTVRRATRLLRERGLVATVPSLGTYVRRGPERHDNRR
jgi:GntR family transcriptional regulator